jgi:hypothetical protein
MKRPTLKLKGKTTAEKRASTDVRGALRRPQSPGPVIDDALEVEEGDWLDIQNIVPREASGD